MATPKQQLTKFLKEDKIILVIGAGASQAAAGVPGWRGIIESGLTYASERSLYPQFIKEANNFLIKNKLTEAAKVLKKILNAPCHPFSDWLEDEFGDLSIGSNELLNSIDDLSTSIILTTNYDNLLSSFSPLNSKKVFDWTEHELIIRTLKKKENFILHLHGVYQKPQTIILSVEDYSNLSKERAYKSILEQLWMGYHFLFIGCSKDGVMDDDFSTVLSFLDAWFPTYPHQHFILLSQKDIDANIHVELLEKCNIQSICYGTRRDDLPGFINELNPNKEKAIQNKIRLREYIDSRLPSLFPETPNEKIKSKGVNDFLQDILPLNDHWVNSNQINILDEALIEYNKNLVNDGEKFANYQAIIQGLVTVTELENKVELWRSNGFNVPKYEQGKFIEVALLAYSSIKRFPKEVLEVVNRKKPFVIHPYYFDNYLDSFIWEYQTIKESGINIEKFYEDDDYFFENLKRIIESLESLLSLDPKEIYLEIEPPVSINILPDTFLLIATTKDITIRNAESPEKIMAKLPLERNLETKKVEVVKFQKKTLVQGYNSLYFFVWDPTSLEIAKHYFTACSNENIIFSYSFFEALELFSIIITDQRNIILKNYTIQESNEFIFNLSDPVYSKEYSKLFASNSGDSLYRGPCLYQMNNDKKWIGIYSKQQLWDYVLEFSEVKILYEKCKKENKEDSNYFLFIRSIKPKIVMYNNHEIIICTFSFSIGGDGGTCLFFFEIKNEIIDMVKRIYLPNNYDLHVETLNMNRLLLSSNFYSMRADYIINLEIPAENMSVIDINKISSKCQISGSDIINLKILNSKYAFANQNGEKLLQININDLSNKEFEFPDNERLILINTYPNLYYESK